MKEYNIKKCVFAILPWAFWQYDNKYFTYISIKGADVKEGKLQH